MNLYLKQKVFSWNDKFAVYDEQGNDIFYVEGELFSWGKKLHVLGLGGDELAFVHQKLFTFLPKYYISIDGIDIAEVVREFTFFRQSYSVNGLGWRVEGDFFDHEYEIFCGDVTVARISKVWFSWGDSYEISIAEGFDPISVLAVVLVVDACIDADSNN